MKSKLILMAAAALAVGGCNRHDADTQSQYTHLNGTETALITQPVLPDREPVPSDANKVAPGTDASAAFAAAPAVRSAKGQRGDNAIPPEHVDVAAQDAAAKAPDTATADEEKRRVQEEFANGDAGPHETVAAAPASAPPTHEEEPRQQ